MSNENRCGVKAVASYRWGSPNANNSYACEEHATGLQTICNHMGWNQTFVPLPEDTEHTCGSIVEVDEPPK